MKKCVSVSAMIVLMMAMTSMATSMVQKVSLVQTTGGSATYDAQSQVLTWSAGGSGMVATDQGDFTDWSNATVTATFSGVSDLSAGGIAAASFTSGTWEFQMTKVLGNYGSVFKIWGNLNTSYNDIEALPDQLIGDAIANVQGIQWDYNPVYPDWGFGVVDVAWADPSNLGSLSSSTVFESELSGYVGGWFSDNLTAQITSVPEPATMTLVLAGIVGILKRRK